MRNPFLKEELMKTDTYQMLALVWRDIPLTLALWLIDY